MSLVKMMRKNSNKIMVFLLIFIMVGFVLGASLPALFRQLNIWFSTGKFVALFDDSTKINRQDLQQAQTELKVLRELMMDQFLYLKPTMMQTPDFKARFLGQVLFPDSRIASAISDELKKSASTGKLQVKVSDIDSFFLQIKGRSDINWILLNAEAKKAGTVVSDETAKQALKQLIPALTQGRADAATVVNSISSRLRLTEKQIVGIVADLFGILVYADNITNFEDVTINQIKSLVGRGSEKISSEFVEFQVNTSNPKLPEPTKQAIEEQFNTYKNFVAGQITEDNPFGFGYMQPASVRIEYLIVNVNDVRARIQAPTDQEMEDYYETSYPEKYYQEPVDPNAPNGEKVAKVRDYSEVSGRIRTRIISEKTNAKADMIINDALDILETSVANDEAERATSSFYKENAGSYEEASANLTEKYGVEVFTGKTGKLSKAKLASDRNLGRMTEKSQTTTNDVKLDKIVFAIEEIGETILGKFEVSTPKMWQNIGPLKHPWGKIGIVRIIEADKPSAPDNPYVMYDVRGTSLDPLMKDAADLYILKTDIIADLKLIEAMKLAEEKANDFVKELDKKSWEEAIDSFNKSISSDSPINKLSLTAQTDKIRPPLMEAILVELRTAENSVIDVIARRTAENLLQSDIYKLIPKSQTRVEDVREIIKSAPNGSYYVVKDASRTQATTENYDKTKITAAFSLNMTRSEALALDHFSPDNLRERMSFQWTLDNSAAAQEKEQKEDIQQENDDDKQEN